MVSYLPLIYSHIVRLYSRTHVGVFPLKDQFLCHFEDCGVYLEDLFLVEVDEDAEGLGLVFGYEVGEDRLESQGFSDEEETGFTGDATGNSAVY